MIVALSPNFYRLCRSLAGYTFQRYYRLKVEGLEYVPAQGPVVLCPKHQRWEDIPVVGLAVPRPLHYIAKVELFRHPFIREFLRALGGVPVDRQRPRSTLSSFRALQPLLKEQAAIVVFPEGTYVRGGVGPGKHRLLQLLLKLKNADGVGSLPFVPLGISYLPRKAGYDVHVRVGPPVTVPAAQEAASLTQALMGEIARLSG